MMGMQFDLLTWSPAGTSSSLGERSNPSTPDHDRCTVCRRGLSSPAARAAGMGPVCARRNGVSLGGVEGAKEPMQAVYSYQIAHGVLCIVDSGTGASVTNDADRVIRTIGSHLDLAAVKGVIYRDTRGIWDEMVLKDGEFETFRSINAEDRDDAIIALKKRDRPYLLS